MLQSVQTTLWDTHPWVHYCTLLITVDVDKGATDIIYPDEGKWTIFQVDGNLEHQLFPTPSHLLHLKSIFQNSLSFFTKLR